MPKAAFLKDFVWAPRRSVRIVYQAGKTYGVTSACHAEAVKAGAVPSDDRRRTVLAVSPSGGVADLDVVNIGRGR